MPRSSYPGRGPDLFLRRSTARRRGMLFFGVILVAVIVVAAAARSGGPSRPAASPGPGRHGSGGPPVVHIPLKHIVFIVKENRTFDNYFGKYPGADGTTVGKGLNHQGQTITIPLHAAPDVQPHDIT